METIEEILRRRARTGDRSILASLQSLADLVNPVDQERPAQRALTRPRRPPSAKRGHPRRAESPRRRSTSSKTQLRIDLERHVFINQLQV